MPGNPLEEFVPNIPAIASFNIQSSNIAPEDCYIKIPTDWFKELLDDGVLYNDIIHTVQTHLSSRAYCGTHRCRRTVWYYAKQMHEGNITRENNAFSSDDFNLSMPYVDLFLSIYNHVYDDKGWCFIDDSYSIEPRDNGCVLVGEEGDSESYWQYEEDCRWGRCYHGEGWIDTQVGDYCYSERDDIYFDCDDTATNEYYHWRECCEDYVHEDTGECCDRYRDNECSFDNCFHQMGATSYLNTSSMNYTFGVEIETCTRRSVDYNGLNLKSVEDGSIEGYEYVTGVLKGDKGVAMLKSICKELRASDTLVDRKCGVHIHIGNTIFNRRFSIMLLKLCKMIEKDIYSMLPPSRADNTYCKLLPDTVNRMNLHNYKSTLGPFVQGVDISREYNKKTNHPGGHYNGQRYYWVNLTNCSARTGPETVEFRPHSATIDFKKIYNWLLICMSIVKFAENNQRRIITAGFSRKGNVTLHEVLKGSLNDRLYNSVWTYVKNRAEGFGYDLSVTE